MHKNRCFLIINFNLTDFDNAIELFNEGDYFAAHDAFEALWVDSSDDKRLFLQGLIQFSVGMFHLGSGNLKGAHSQFNRSLNKLNSFPDIFLDVNNGEIRYFLNEIIHKLGKLDLDLKTKFEIEQFPAINKIKN